MWWGEFWSHRAPPAAPSCLDSSRAESRFLWESGPAEINEHDTPPAAFCNKRDQALIRPREQRLVPLIWIKVKEVSYSTNAHQEFLNVFHLCAWPLKPPTLSIISCIHVNSFTFPSFCLWTSLKFGFQIHPQQAKFNIYPLWQGEKLAATSGINNT